MLPSVHPSQLAEYNLQLWQCSTTSKRNPPIFDVTTIITTDRLSHLHRIVFVKKLDP